MSEPPVPRADLAACDREPIHVPGAIQPHGALVALREPELVVLQASANLGALLGAPDAAAPPGSRFAALCDGDSGEALRAALAGERLEDANPLRLALLGTSCAALLHRHDGALIVELFPADEGAPAPGGHFPLRRSMARLQAAPDLATLFASVVDEVRRTTGYERVMVYRFDADGHGVVEAEARDEGLEPYLGLRYPASDIPRQARELYLRNPIRVIPDARYTPVPLVPARRPDNGAPLDLTHALLRGISPVHLEYMANMGVRASMSVSLIVRDALWGLVACVQHGGPKGLSHEAREDCEILGRLASLQIAALEDREAASRGASRQAPLETLAAAMREGEEALAALLSRPGELLALVGAEGAAVVTGDEVAAQGRTPPADVVAEVAGWLGARAGASVLATDSLPAELPAALPAKDTASGVLGFALPGRRRRVLLLFRPEILQTVSWGGDPTKAVAAVPGDRPHPRRSFALWQEQVRLRSAPWSAASLEAAEDLRRHAVEIDLGHQVERERRAVRARDDLVAVVSHDLRNPLGVIQMQATLLRRVAEESVEQRPERLRASLDRIGRATDRMNALVHDLLDLAKIEAERFSLRLHDEPMHEMVEEALLILRPLAEVKRVALVAEPTGEALVRVDRERVFQVLSNLVGNAIKFTPEGGRITLRSEVQGDCVVFTVADTGPGVPDDQMAKLFDRYWQAAQRSREGAGLGLFIAKGIVEAHGGRIWVERAAGGGACFRFTLPLAASSAAAGPPAQPAP